MSGSPERRRIAVIGAGITGLAAAHRSVELARDRQIALELSVFESSNGVGGTIGTERSGDYLLELGPDCFLTEKPWCVDLAQRIGLGDEMISTREMLRRTYVLRKGQLHPLPEGFIMMAPVEILPFLFSNLFSWPGKLRMALDLILPRRQDDADESLTEFVTRRLGPEALQRVVQPLIGGIYTADPNRLSVRATMPRFLAMEREHGSVIRAMRRQRAVSTQHLEASGARWSLFASFRDGMQTLPDRLASLLPGGTIRLSSNVDAISPAEQGTWSIGSEAFDHVILATGAPHASRLLREIDPALRGELDAIEHASSAVVTMAFRREEIPHPLGGFGFVVPHIERREILACSFSSLKFEGRAPAEMVLMRIFLGGALQPELMLRSDDEVIETARREVTEILGVRGAPALTRVTRWMNAMPQYHVGHLDRVDRIERRIAALAGIELAGSAYRGVGIPDSIHSGEEAAERAIGGR